MKILFVVDQFPSVSTPFILNQITGVIDRGHEVEILSRLHGDGKVLHEDVLKYKLIEKTHYLTPVPLSYTKRVLTFFLSLFPIIVKTPKIVIEGLNFVKYGKSIFSLRYYFDLISFPLNKKYDIIHAQFGPLGVLIDKVRSAGFISGKLITQFRGYDVSVLLNHEKEDYYHQLFKRGDMFLANCLFFRNKILNLGAPENKSFVQYSGVKIENFSQKRIKPRRYDNVVHLGTVARLSGKKGIEYILKSLSWIRKNRIDIEFKYEIVGDGEMKLQLLQMTKDLGLDNYVTFLGAQNHRYISDFLFRTDIFISHNITSDKGDQDAPVNTIKEAFLAELPVVSTLHGGIPELVKNAENGYTSAEKDVEAFAKNIVQLIDNEQKCLEFGRHGKEFVKDIFDNDKLNNQLIDFYRQALNI